MTHRKPMCTVEIYECESASACQGYTTMREWYMCLLHFPYCIKHSFYCEALGDVNEANMDATLLHTVETRHCLGP